MTNGAVTITHTTNIPLYSRSLYAQVDGNADYDLFYTRKYIPAAPKVNNGAEEFINISPSITDAQCFKTGTGYVNCTSFQYGDILEKVRANCTSSIGGTISLAEFTFRNINEYDIFR